jgi:hypothetical protein
MGSKMWMLMAGVMFDGRRKSKTWTKSSRADDDKIFHGSDHRTK